MRSDSKISRDLANCARNGAHTGRFGRNDWKSGSFQTRKIDQSANKSVTAQKQALDNLVFDDINGQDIILTERSFC
jgi:hypothetical protein